MNDPTFFYRQAVLNTSDLVNEDEIAFSALKFIDEIGRQLVAEANLSEGQRQGIALALNDTPIAFAKVLGSVRFSADRQIVKFMLAKLIDDMLSLGAVAMIAGNPGTKDKVLSRAGRKGAEIGLKTRKKKQAVWQEEVLRVAKSIEKIEKLSNPSITTIIITRSKPNGVDLPGYDTILDFVAELRKKEVIPKKLKKAEKKVGG